MAKQNRTGSRENPATKTDFDMLNIPEYVIVNAKLNDGKVDFSFRMQKGIHTGEVSSTKGVGIFFDSLQTAFNKFNVHLAVIDEAYKHKGVEIEDIDTMHQDELAMTYSVDGFKIKGEDDGESIILVGSKYTALGDISIETPKIPLDSLSGYKWYNELKTASDLARKEVARYKEGNFEMPEKEEKPTGKQMKITDMAKVNGFDNEVDFSEAAV